MNAITLKQAAAWCGGTVAQEFEDVVFRGACNDTRKLKKGQLFVALRGEKADGHMYIQKALTGGAAAILCEQPQDASVPAIVVEDALAALGAIAKGYRLELDAKVIGITGSVGKTTTKEMVALVTQTTFKTSKTVGNHNNHIGLPLSILEIDRDTQVVVLEMGMNHFKEMAYLTSIAQPDIAVITNIGTMHIEHLGSREGILQAKLEILEGLRQQGSIVFRGDEPLLWNLRNREYIQPIYFGIENSESDLLAKNICAKDGGIEFFAEGLGSGFQVWLPVEGKHHVEDALAAIAVGSLLGIQPEKMQQALATFENTGMRQKTYTKNGYDIIEDCYNAGPESMIASLEVLAGRKKAGRRIAVLGDMLELGACSGAEHYRVGRVAAKCADMIFAYGPSSYHLISGAITGGMNQKCANYFDTQEELVNAVRHFAKPGDVLLFKGSRGMKMEEALKSFLKKNNVR